MQFGSSWYYCNPPFILKWYIRVVNHSMSNFLKLTFERIIIVNGTAVKIIFLSIPETRGSNPGIALIFRTMDSRREQGTG